MPHIPPSFLSFGKVQNIRLVPTTLLRVPQQQGIFLVFSHLLWKCNDIQSIGAHTPMGIHTRESCSKMLFAQSLYCYTRVLMVQQMVLTLLSHWKLPWWSSFLAYKDDELLFKTAAGGNYYRDPQLVRIQNSSWNNLYTKRSGRGGQKTRSCLLDVTGINTLTRSQQMTVWTRLTQWHHPLTCQHGWGFPKALPLDNELQAIDGAEKGRISFFQGQALWSII